MMQTGQDKYGMQTLNQSLATLYRKRQITMETAMSISGNIDELMDLVGHQTRPTAKVPIDGNTLQRFRETL
jgi:twitching motility protein PilT